MGGPPHGDAPESRGVGGANDHGRGGRLVCCKDQLRCHPRMPAEIASFGLM